jgi:hypothetical protein
MPFGIGGARVEEDVLMGVPADEVGGAERVLDAWPAVRVDWRGRVARDRCEQYVQSVVLEQELMVRGGGRQSWQIRCRRRSAGGEHRSALPYRRSCHARFAVEVTDARPAETIDGTDAKSGVAAASKPM